MLEFDWIAQYYADKVAERSKVPLIQHIKEGLLILQAENTSDYAQRAYCLHPIFQSDEALQASYGAFDFESVPSKVILLACEYRNIANQYLSRRQVQTIDEIQLSPLEEVNQMLIADKIQNCKDFERYHKKSHPRSVELTQYFANWFARLGITAEKYTHYCQLIEKNTLPTHENNQS